MLPESKKVSQELTRLSQAILKKNRIFSASTTFTVASLANPLYAEMQAFWDSCFHAYILASLEPKIAKQEIRALLNNINEEGSIPHMIYYTGRGKIVPLKFKSILETFWSSSSHSNLLQPPVLALAVYQIFDQAQDTQFLREVIPQLERYYRFLGQTRDHDKDHLLAIIHSWESGWDNSQRWDDLYHIRTGKQQEIDRQKAELIKAYQQVDWDLEQIFDLDLFVVKPVDFNVLYAWNLELLSILCQTINRSHGFFKEKANLTKDAIFHKMYDGTTFFDLYGNHELSNIPSAAMFFPMLLDHPFDYSVILSSYLDNKNQFNSPNGVPSSSLNHPLHSPNEYWRGNIWIQINWFIFRGLLIQNQITLAMNLAKKIMHLLYQNGFWEYFNPHTGVGLGAGDYSWDSLVVDLIEKYRTSSNK